jgi:hypothetical protein
MCVILSNYLLTCVIFRRIHSKTTPCFLSYQLCTHEIFFSSYPYNHYNTFCTNNCTYFTRNYIKILHGNIPNDTLFFTTHTIFNYAHTFINSINVRDGVFVLHAHFRFMVQRENTSIMLWNKGNTCL